MIENEFPLLTPEGLVPALNPIRVKDGEGLYKLKRYFEKKAEREKSPVIALDYETNMVPTFHTRRARTLQIGDRDEQYLIDFLDFAQSTQALIDGQGRFKTPSWAQAIVDVIEPVFNSKAFLKVGQNLGFEYEQSWYNLGMRLWHLYSVDLAERVIWCGLHSFKDLPFYSLARQTERHFQRRVDKSRQKMFDLETPITAEDEVYMCFDLRLPLAIRQKQLPILEQDNLLRVTQIENDAIGYFTDIHLNGIRTHREKWSGLVSEWVTGKREAIERLDTQMLRVVGPKNVDDSNLEPALAEWKNNTVDGPEELEIKAQIKATKDKSEKETLKALLTVAVDKRKAKRDLARAEYNKIRSSITAARNIFDACEGEAAINYSSNAQLKKALLRMKGFTPNNLPNTEDDTLKAFAGHPVIDALRDLRSFNKNLETYGPQWYTEYKDEPSAEQGWVSPQTGKIHSTLNQLEADTGRTSSTKPNIQNLPADERVRSCFVADPPDESIRISTCCDSDTEVCIAGGHICLACNSQCETRAEDFVIVGVDMSGAELRIIAEESGSKQWIDAFNKGWDLHSCGTETLYPTEWPAATCTPGEVIVKKGKEKVLPPCSYFNKVYVESLGREEDHQKCECPKHQAYRNDNKATNFLLAYGGGPDTLAEKIEKSRDEAALLMDKHERANPEVWAYLERSGKEAVSKLESRSKCGRRRSFRRPDRVIGRERAQERKFERMKKGDGLTRVLPNGLEQKLTVEDMIVTDRDINWTIRGMYGSIERQGKNLRIQSLNATIAKLAAGCGFCRNGKPFLWHTLYNNPKLKAKAINFIHDEFLTQCPRRFAPQVLALKKDAILRAGAEFLEKVLMESEGRIAPEWQK